MKIYHSAMRIPVLLRYNNAQPRSRPNVLLSYALRNDISGFTKRHRDKIDSLMFDSGTFTLHTKGYKAPLPITFEGYKKYLRHYGRLYDFVMNFDKEFSRAKAMDNVAYLSDLEAEGFAPLPVVHNLYGPEVDYYIENRGRYPLVAIGSTEGKRLALLEPVVNRLVRNGIKVHILGTTRFNLLYNLPIESCDASNWTQHGNYGKVLYWNPLKPGINKTDVIYLEDYVKLDLNATYPGIRLSRYPYKAEFIKYLEDELNLSHYDLIGPDRFDVRGVVNLHYYMGIERLMSISKL